MGIDLDSSDSLRNPRRALEPDPRTGYFSKLDHNLSPQLIGLADQYDAVASFQLEASVPEDVAIHFETVKNLYLYAWFVFRFYPVAEQQALTSLEFALKKRLVGFIEEYKRKHPKAGPPGLSRLLLHARAEGLIRNEALTGREGWALAAARQRYSLEKIREMEVSGLSEMELDDSHVVPTEADLQHDWLDNFVKAIPRIRNDYAHGSATLRRTVLHTFDVVCQLINQLYLDADGGTGS